MCICSSELFTSVHYFIHLNLAIALLLGYTVFLAGVDTAVGNRVSKDIYLALFYIANMKWNHRWGRCSSLHCLHAPYTNIS